MFFNGKTFASGKHTLASSPAPSTAIKSIQIMNGVFDGLYITRNEILPYTTEIEDVWDINTVFHAKFMNNLAAGNTDYSIANTDQLKIKRRKKGTFHWVCIFQKPVRIPSDFYFYYDDYTARSNTHYEYALVAASNHIETSEYKINEIKTFFDGLFIVEKGIQFSTKIGHKISPLQRHKPKSIIPTLGNKYPFIISNGKSNYNSVSITGIFAEIMKDPCNIDFENSWAYRERFNDFLCNGRTKLIKYYDGRMYLAPVSSGTINENDLGNDDIVETTFEITEIGNCDHGADLYDYGLIDVKEDNGLIVAINEIEERFGRIEQSIAILRESKADDITYDVSKGTINLKAQGADIGRYEDLETPLGREMYVVER